MKLYKLVTTTVIVLAALTFAILSTFAQTKTQPSRTVQTSLDKLSRAERNAVSQSYSHLAKEGNRPLVLKKMSLLRAAEVSTLSDNFFKSAKEGNLRGISEVMSPEFRFIDEQGQMVAAANCSAALEAMVSGPDLSQSFQTERIRINSYDIRDAKIMEVGDSIIETMIYSDNVTVQPRNTQEVVTFDRTFRWTNVWTKRDGTLKVALTQLSPLKDTGKTGANPSNTGTTFAQAAEGSKEGKACPQATATLGLLPLAVASLIIPAAAITIRRRSKARNRLSRVE